MDKFIHKIRSFRTNRRHSDFQSIKVKQTIIRAKQIVQQPPVQQLAQTCSVGLAVTTFGFSPYINLHLEQAKRLYPHLPIVICDDHSNDDELYKCAYMYNCDVLSTERRYGWLPGDIMLWRIAIEWAAKNKINYVVKMSRRFIPLIDFSKSLIEIVDDSDTYGRGRRKTMTFCVGLAINYWHHKTKEIYDLAQNYSKPKHGIPERCMGRLKKKFKSWDFLKPSDTDYIHYWRGHEQSLSRYFLLSQQLDLSYIENDFKPIDSSRQ